jgi:acetyltransferase-like isoleucine patch superfamily enzyme
MTLAEKIKQSPKLKKFILWILIPINDFRPRWWVRTIVVPFIGHRGKSSIIRKSCRLDIFPNYPFKLDSQSLIESFSVINNAVGEVVIGKQCVIGISSVVIGPVRIGDKAIIAQHVVISGLNHGYEQIDIAPAEQKVVTKPINIGENVWIGANAVITAGTRIGKHCIVGANSVVTKDIPDYCVVGGNPARIIKKYNFTTKAWEKHNGA